MDENKDIEKVSRTAFEQFKIGVPDNGWDLLDAALDKRQGLIYRQRANRFKLLSIVLALFLFSLITCYYLVPSSATKKLSNISAENKPADDNTSHNAVKDDNLLGRNNTNISKKGSTNSKETNTSYPVNKIKETTLSSEIRETNSSANKNTVYDKMHSRTVSLINSLTDKKNSSAELSASKANAISNKFADAINDSDKVDVNEQSVLATAISDSVLVRLPGSYKSDSSYIVNSDSTKNSLSGDSLFNTGARTTSRLSIAIFGSPNYSSTHLKDNTADNFDDVTMYSSREKSQLSFIAGFLLKYDLSGRWSMATGLSYSAIKYSITVPVMYAGYNANNELHFEYPTSSGIIQMPDESNQQMHEGDSIKMTSRCAQSFKYVNVPLLARFQITKNKFNFYATGGPSVNFIVQEKAKMNIGNAETTIINHIDGLKKMNYGFLLGAGIQYNILDDLGIFIEPLFTGSITSITRGTAVNSYPYSLGLTVGVSLHL